MLRECRECSGAGAVLHFFRGWVEIDRATYEQLKARPDLARSAHEPLAREFPCARCRGTGRVEVAADPMRLLSSR